MTRRITKLIVERAQRIGTVIAVQGRSRGRLLLSLASSPDVFIDHLRNNDKNQADVISM